MSGDLTDACICRKLLDLGIVEALENAAERDAIFVAIQACLDKSACLQQLDTTELPATVQAPVAAPPDQAPDGGASRRKRSDRRAGEDRRKNRQDWPPGQERRRGERRSGGDRRGLLAGEQYTPQQAVLNLRAWCNGHCKAPFELFLDQETQELRFRFEDPTDRAGFTEMLRKFKGMSPQT